MVKQHIRDKLTLNIKNTGQEHFYTKKISFVIKVCLTMINKLELVFQEIKIRLNIMENIKMGIGMGQEFQLCQMEELTKEHGEKIVCMVEDKKLCPMGINIWFLQIMGKDWNMLQCKIKEIIQILLTRKDQTILTHCKILKVNRKMRVLINFLKEITLQVKIDLPTKVTCNSRIMTIVMDRVNFLYNHKI